jgi:hypothetical protein
MMLKALPLVLLAALAVMLVGCSDNNGPTAPRVAEMTWILEDACSDGLGLQARLFDVDQGIVFPSIDQVFFTDPGGAIDTTIACTRSTLVCYGATTDPETNIFWGLDIDGTQDCDDCCERCEDVVVQFQLTC